MSDDDRGLGRGKIAPIEVGRVELVSSALTMGREEEILTSGQLMLEGLLGALSVVADDGTDVRPMIASLGDYLSLPENQKSLVETLNIILMGSDSEEAEAARKDGSLVEIFEDESIH